MTSGALGKEKEKIQKQGATIEAYERLIELTQEAAKSYQYDIETREPDFHSPCGYTVIDNNNGQRVDYFLLWKMQ